MLAFDLPDYSKSSTAQNEKSARESEKEMGGGGGGGGDSAGAPISIPSLS